MNEAKLKTKEYWEARPCGVNLSTSQPGSVDFFSEVETSRYELEPCIPAFAEFPRWSGHRVLEIGVGLGTDFISFARAGAQLSGIDLTQASIDLVRKRLDHEGLQADLRVGDAESLPFSDRTFDLVYSWGVLHHTPDTAKAIAEVRRVIAPGGEARIMLYSRRSLLAYAFWVRHALLRGRPLQSIRTVLAEHMESPGTKAYTQSEVRELFRDFSDVRTTSFVTPYERKKAAPFFRLTGDRFGWFIGIVARP